SRAIEFGYGTGSRGRGVPAHPGTGPAPPPGAGQSCGRRRARTGRAARHAIARGVAPACLGELRGRPCTAARRVRVAPRASFLRRPRAASAGPRARATRAREETTGPARAARSARHRDQDEAPWRGPRHAVPVARLVACGSKESKSEEKLDGLHVRSASVGRELRSAAFFAMYI